MTPEEWDDIAKAMLKPATYREWQQQPNTLAYKRHLATGEPCVCTHCTARAVTPASGGTR